MEKTGIEIAIITGISGSGKSTAINTLEDIGFFCVDNVPPKLMLDFTRLFTQLESGNARNASNKIAFVTDIRGGEGFLDIDETVREIKSMGIRVKILFLDASDEVIKRRYKETRRRHPLFHSTDAAGATQNTDIDTAIKTERGILAPIAGIADLVIDTGLLSTSLLKETILGGFLERISDSLSIKCMSFGFKYGSPSDADLVFDVRCLPNPFYVPELKKVTGLDKKVRDFVMNSDISINLEKKLYDLIGFLLPCYVAEGKSQLVIAFGCTGGKHRSVTFTYNLSQWLEETGYKVTTFHRDIGTWNA